MPCQSDPNWTYEKCTSPSEWSKVNNDFFVKEPHINTENISKDNLLDKIELRKLKEHNHFLEAALCAIFTELEKRQLANKLLKIASENGKINLIEFWENHKQKDIDRLQTQLSKYSQHEIDIIKKILCKLQ